MRQMKIESEDSITSEATSDSETSDAASDVVCSNFLPDSSDVYDGVRNNSHKYRKKRAVINKRRDVADSRYKSISANETRRWPVVLHRVGCALFYTLHLLHPVRLLQLVAGIFNHINDFTLSVNSRSRRRRKLLSWLRQAVPHDRQVPNLTTVWRDGTILCSVIETAIPGSCTELHRSQYGHISLQHAQMLASRHLGVQPMFTYEDLHQVTFSVYLERRLIRYLQSFRTALTQLYYNRNSLSRRLRNFGQSIFGFTPAIKQIDRPPPLPVDCVLKGMGLIVAVQERRSSFYIYFLQPQHSHLLRIQHHQHYDSEPADIAVFIRGPQGDYGEVIIQHLNPCKSTSYKSLNFSATKSSCNIPINYRLTTRYIRINYMPQSPGTHELAVLRRGYHLPGSPFLVTVDVRSQYAVPQSYAFSDDEECSKNKANRRRLRVMFRVVDFVTEKMLLTEDGRLEKLPVLMSERMLAYRSSQTSSSSPDSLDSGDVPIQRQRSANCNLFKTKAGKDHKHMLRGRWRKVMLLCRFFAKHSSDHRRLQILRAAGHIFDGRPVRLTESTLKLIEEAVSAIPNDNSLVEIDEVGNVLTTQGCDENIETAPTQQENCNEISNLDISSEILEANKTGQDQSMEGLRELYKSSNSVGLNLITHLQDEKDKGAITTRKIACSQHRKDASIVVGKGNKTDLEEVRPTRTETSIINSVPDEPTSSNITKSKQNDKTQNKMNLGNNKTQKRHSQDINDARNKISHIPVALELEANKYSSEEKTDEHLDSNKYGAQSQNKSGIKGGTDDDLDSKYKEYNVDDFDHVSTERKDNKRKLLTSSEDLNNMEQKQMNSIKILQGSCENLSGDITEPARQESSEYVDLEIIPDVQTEQKHFFKDTALSPSKSPNENKHLSTSHETEVVTDRTNLKQSKLQTECPSAAVQRMIMKFEQLQKENSLDLANEKVNSDNVLQSPGDNTQAVGQIFERQAVPCDQDNKAVTKQTTADPNTLEKQETKRDPLKCSLPTQLTPSVSSHRTAETNHKVLEDSQLENDSTVTVDSALVCCSDGNNARNAAIISAEPTSLLSSVDVQGSLESHSPVQTEDQNTVFLLEDQPNGETCKMDISRTISSHETSLPHNDLPKLHTLKRKPVTSEIRPNDLELVTLGMMSNTVTSPDVMVSEGVRDSDRASEEGKLPYSIKNKNEPPFDFSKTDIPERAVALNEANLPIGTTVTNDLLKKFPTNCIESKDDNSATGGSSKTGEKIIQPVVVTNKSSEIIKEFDGETSVLSASETVTITADLKKKLSKPNTSGGRCLPIRPIPMTEIPKCNEETHSTSHLDVFEENSSLLRGSYNNNLLEERLTHSIPTLCNEYVVNNEPQSTDTGNVLIPSHIETDIYLSRCALTVIGIPCLRTPTSQATEHQNKLSPESLEPKSTSGQQDQKSPSEPQTEPCFCLDISTASDSSTVFAKIDAEPEAKHPASELNKDHFESTNSRDIGIAELKLLTDLVVSSGVQNQCETLKEEREEENSGSFLDLYSANESGSFTSSSKIASVNDGEKLFVTFEETATVLEDSKHNFKTSATNTEDDNESLYFSSCPSTPALRNNFAEHETPDITTVPYIRHFEDLLPTKETASSLPADISDSYDALADHKEFKCIDFFKEGKQETGCRSTSDNVKNKSASDVSAVEFKASASLEFSTACSEEKEEKGMTCTEENVPALHEMKIESKIFPGQESRGIEPLIWSSAFTVNIPMSENVFATVIEQRESVLSITEVETVTPLSVTLIEQGPLFPDISTSIATVTNTAVKQDATTGAVAKGSEFLNDVTPSGVVLKDKEFQQVILTCLDIKEGGIDIEKINTGPLTAVIAEESSDKFVKETYADPLVATSASNVEGSENYDSLSVYFDATEDLSSVTETIETAIAYKKENIASCSEEESKLCRQTTSCDKEATAHKEVASFATYNEDTLYANLVDSDAIEPNLQGSAKIQNDTALIQGVDTTVKEAFTTQSLVQALTVKQPNLEFCTSMPRVQVEKRSSGLNKTAISKTEKENRDDSTSEQLKNAQYEISEPVFCFDQREIGSTSEDTDPVRQNAPESINTQSLTATDTIQESEILTETDIEGPLLILEENIESPKDTSCILGDILKLDLQNAEEEEASTASVANIALSKDLLTHAPSEGTTLHSSSGVDKFGLYLWDTKAVSERISETEGSVSQRSTSQDSQPRAGSHRTINSSDIGQTADATVGSSVALLTDTKFKANHKSTSSSQDVDTRSEEDLTTSPLSISDEVDKYDLVSIHCLTGDTKTISNSAICNEPDTFGSINSAWEYHCQEETNKHADTLELLQDAGMANLTAVNSERYLENATSGQEIGTVKNEELDPFETAKLSPNPEDKLAYNPWTTPLICSTASCSPTRKQPEVFEEKIACNPWSTAAIGENHISETNGIVQSTFISNTHDDTPLPVRSQAKFNKVLETEGPFSETLTSAFNEVTSESVYKEPQVNNESRDAGNFMTSVGVSLETSGEDNNVAHKHRPGPSTTVHTAAKTIQTQCEIQNTATKDCHKVEQVEVNEGEEFINQEFIRDLDDLRYIQNKERNFGQNKSRKCNVSVSYDANSDKNNRNCDLVSESITKENKFEDTDVILFDEVPTQKLDQEVCSNVEAHLQQQEVLNSTEQGADSAGEHFMKQCNSDGDSLISNVANSNATSVHGPSIIEKLTNHDWEEISNVSGERSEYLSDVSITSEFMNDSQKCFKEKVAWFPNLDEDEKGILDRDIISTEVDGESLHSKNNFSLCLTNSNVTFKSSILEAENRLPTFEYVKILVIPPSPTGAVSPSENDLLCGSLTELPLVSEDSAANMSESTSSTSMENLCTEYISCLNEDEERISREQQSKENHVSDEAAPSCVTSITGSDKTIKPLEYEDFLENNDDSMKYEQSNNATNLRCSENDIFSFLSTNNPASVMHDTTNHNVSENTAENANTPYDKPQLEMHINLSEAQNESNLLDLPEETSEGNISESQHHHSLTMGTTDLASISGSDSLFSVILEASPNNQEFVKKVSTIPVISKCNLEGSQVIQPLGNDQEDTRVLRQKEGHVSETDINRNGSTSPKLETDKKYMNNVQEPQHKDEVTEKRIETSKTNEAHASESNCNEISLPSQDLTTESAKTLLSFKSNEPEENKTKPAGDQNKETPENMSANELTLAFDCLSTFSSRNEEDVYTEAVKNEEDSDIEELYSTRSQRNSKIHIVEHDWTDAPYLACRESSPVSGTSNTDTHNTKIHSVEPDWIDAPYLACRESSPVSGTSNNSQGKDNETQTWVDTQPKSPGHSSSDIFLEFGEVVLSSRTPEEVRLLEATLLDIEDSSGFCNEFDDELTSTRGNLMDQENKRFELSLNNPQNQNESFRCANQNSNVNFLAQAKFGTLDLINPFTLNESLSVSRYVDDNTAYSALGPTTFDNCDSRSEEVHAACFADGAMACAIMDTQPVFDSRCPLLVPDDGPVLASSPSQFIVEKSTSFFPDLDDLLSKDFTTYMSSSGDQFHLWPSDVAFGSPSSNLDENIDFDSVLAAPNLEEALRKLEHDIQKRKEEQTPDSTTEEKSEGEAADDKSLSADVENEDLSSSPSIAWNGDDNNLVEEANMEEEEENLPDQANGAAEEENLSYDIGDSDYVSLDDIQSSFKHSPDSRDTDDSRNDSSYSAGQREDQDGAASSRNRKLRSFEYSQEEQEFRHMQGGSNAVISGFMGPAEREIWGLDANGDDKDKPREAAVSVEETPSDSVSAEKQGTSEVEDQRDEDSDENEEEESDIDWAAALSNVRCYPRVLSPGTGPSMSAIVEENEDDNSAQLSGKQKKGSDGDMTNTVSETRDQPLVTLEETEAVPEMTAHSNLAGSFIDAGASNQEAEEINSILITGETANINNDTVTSLNATDCLHLKNDDFNNDNSMHLCLAEQKNEIKNEPDNTIHNMEAIVDISNSQLSTPLELQENQGIAMNKCSPGDDISKFEAKVSNTRSVFENNNLSSINNTNNDDALQPLCVEVIKPKVQVLKSLFENGCAPVSANEKPRISPLKPENKVMIPERLISPKMVLKNIKDSVGTSKNVALFGDKTNEEKSSDQTSGSNVSYNQQIYEEHLETPLISFYTNARQQSTTPENITLIAQSTCFENEAESCSATTVHSVAVEKDTLERHHADSQESAVLILETPDGTPNTSLSTSCNTHGEDILSREIPQELKNTSSIISENKDVTQKPCDSQSSTSKTAVVTTPEMTVGETLTQEDVSTEKFASTVDEIFSEILELDSFDNPEEPQDLAEGVHGTHTVDNSEKLVIPTQPIITVTEPTNEEAAQFEGGSCEASTSGTQLSAVAKCIARRRQYWDDILRLAIEQNEKEVKGRGSQQGIQKSAGLTHSEIYRKLCKRNKFAALRSRKPISVRVHGIVNKWRLAFETLKFLEETESQSTKQTERQPGSNIVEQWKKYWDNLVEEQAQIARYKELSKEEVTKQYKAGEKKTLRVSGIVALERERFEKISSETVDKKHKESIRKRRPRRLERSVNSASPSPERSSRTNQTTNVHSESKPYASPSPERSSRTGQVINVHSDSRPFASPSPERSSRTDQTPNVKFDFNPFTSPSLDRNSRTSETIDVESDSKAFASPSERSSRTDKTIKVQSDSKPFASPSERSSRTDKTINVQSDSKPFASPSERSATTDKTINVQSDSKPFASPSERSSTTDKTINVQSDSKPFASPSERSSTTDKTINVQYDSKPFASPSERSSRTDQTTNVQFDFKPFASPSLDRNSRTDQTINVQSDPKPFVTPGSPGSSDTGETPLFSLNKTVTSGVRLSPEPVLCSEEPAESTKYNSIGLTFKATVTQYGKEENSELPVENILEIHDKPPTTISISPSPSIILDLSEEQSNEQCPTLSPERQQNLIAEKTNVEKDPETKNRFQKAKQFFQMLEQNNSTTKDSSSGPRHRTAGHRKGRNSKEAWGSTISLVEPQTSRPNVEFPDVRPSSVSSAPAYGTWGSIQSLDDKEDKGLRSTPTSSTESLSRCPPFKKLRSPIGGSERCAKVYEKFHVEDLFKDVVGDFGRNCGSLKGIPHQQAVLASLQSVGDRCLSPYDEVGSAATSDDEQPYERSMATSPLPQGYLPEYPYLSTTPARLYRPRSSLVGSSIISRKDLLSVDKTRKS